MRKQKVQPVTDGTREEIRKASVTNIPVNPSERGMTATELQRRFVEPVVGEVSAVTELNRIVGETETALSELHENAESERLRMGGEVARLDGRIVPLEETRGEVQEAMRLSGEMLRAAETAVITANAAASTASAMSGKADAAVTVSGEARTLAAEAKIVAEGIDGKAAEALTLSREAKETANDAKTVADGLDGKIEQKVSELVSSAPETLDTLQELAAALGDDPNFATTVSNLIGKLSADTAAETQRLDEVKLNISDAIQSANLSHKALDTVDLNDVTYTYIGGVNHYCTNRPSGSHDGFLMSIQYDNRKFIAQIYISGNDDTVVKKVWWRINRHNANNDWTDWQPFFSGGQRVTPQDSVSFGAADFKRLGAGKYLTGSYGIDGLPSFEHSALEVECDGEDYYVSAKNRAGELATTGIIDSGTALPWKRFNYTYELDANQDDYIRYVIPLLDLTNDVIDALRYVKGTLYLVRNNGAKRPTTISLFAQKEYNSASAIGNYLNYGGIGGATDYGDTELVTFEHNGRRYLGADVKTTSARYMSALFDGVISDYEVSNVLGKSFGYYDSQTGTVLDSEIFASLINWIPALAMTSNVFAARAYLGVGDVAKINNDEGKGGRFLAAYDPGNVRKYINFGKAPEPNGCAELSFNADGDAHGNSLKMGFYANNKSLSLYSDGALFAPGDVYKPSGGSWLASCDSRVKTDIKDADIDLCYQNVKQLPLKYYGYDRTVFGTDEVVDSHQLGWIAQDVEGVFPKAVRTADMEYIVKDENGNPVVESEAAYEDFVDKQSGEIKKRKVRDKVYKTKTVPGMKHLSYDLIYASAYGAVQKLIEKVESLEDTVSALTGDREILTKNDIYPVGSVYISIKAADPSILFGGTWEKIEGQFLLAESSLHVAGSTGGEETHRLTIAELPKHDHIETATWSGEGSGWGIALRPENTVGSICDALTAPTHGTGEDQPHNNMPPYLAVYMWKRVA